MRIRPLYTIVVSLIVFLPEAFAEGGSTITTIEVTIGYHLKRTVRIEKIENLGKTVQRVILLIDGVATSEKFVANRTGKDLVDHLGRILTDKGVPRLDETLPCAQRMDVMRTTARKDSPSVESICLDSVSATVRAAVLAWWTSALAAAN